MRLFAMQKFVDENEKATRQQGGLLFFKGE
jgi:hypothetical protein